MLKILEAHSGLSALIVDKSKFDGIWISSLTHAASQGLPDNELVDLYERVKMVREFKRLSKKPIIVDVDTLSSLTHVCFFVSSFKDSGAYAIVIEDKKGDKQNSLLENAKQELEEVDVFCQKIEEAKKFSGDMKIVARLESLIAKKSMNEALIRAHAYVKAGADMILIHSKQKVEATEVMEFAKRFREVSDIPLVCVPTTYTLPEEHPFEIVIHANHMLRASMKAMEKVAAGEEVELSSVEEIFDLVGH
jgi:phosphoenolpyruvate phosphomutase